MSNLEQPTAGTAQNFPEIRAEAATTPVSPAASASAASASTASTPAEQPAVSPSGSRLSSAEGSADNSVVVVIVTGMSGSGKSTTLRAFEDRGFFCVDNLPIAFIPELANTLTRAEPAVRRQAYGVDIRDRALPVLSERTVTALRERGFRVDVLFLDAQDDVLVRRFSETRRPHPLLTEYKGDIVRALFAERAMLRELRNLATHTIDTTWMTVHELKGVVNRHLDSFKGKRELQVNVMSFGFKYGVPLEADLVFDARFLANPYFRADLRPLTGQDPRVRDYVLGIDDSVRFLDHIWALIDFTLPRYYAEGKVYLTVAVGCTGGKHRSVVLTEALAQRIRGLGAQGLPFAVNARHRDLGKE